jgi:hypothetical protein
MRVAMRAKRTKQQQQQTCAACRASAYATECGDERLASVIKMHLPPHTCGTSPSLDASHTSPPPPPPPPPSPEDDAALSLKAVDVVAFNRAAEQRFVTLARNLVPCPVSHIVRETAYVLDVSVETAKRYLLKHSASNAEFAIVRGIVVLRQKNQVV